MDPISADKPGTVLRVSDGFGLLIKPDSCRYKTARTLGVLSAQTPALQPSESGSEPGALGAGKGRTGSRSLTVGDSPIPIK